MRRTFGMIAIALILVPLLAGCPFISGGTSTIGKFSGFLGTLFIDPDGSIDDPDGQIEFLRNADGRLVLRGLADNPDIVLVVAIGGDVATASGIRQGGRTDADLTLSVTGDSKITLTAATGDGVTRSSNAFGPITSGNSACTLSAIEHSVTMTTRLGRFFRTQSIMPAVEPV